MEENYMADIKYFGGTFAILDYTQCHGQLLSISEFSALYSLLGTLYGGNGRTTFAVPDLRGRTAVGSGTGPGLTTVFQGYPIGWESHGLHISQLPNHDHAAVYTPASANPYTAKMTTYNGGSSSAEPDGLYPGKSVGGNLYSNGSGFGVSETSLAADAITVTGGSHDGTVHLTPEGNSSQFLLRDPELGLTALICFDGSYPSRN